MYANRAPNNTAKATTTNIVDLYVEGKKGLAVGGRVGVEG